jgi:general secretion pathway protein G
MNFICGKRAGFGLIEIMISLSIIAGLIVGVMQTAKYLNERSKNNNTKNILRAVQNGVNQYKMDLGKYPQKIDNLVNPPSDSAERRRWQGPYVPVEYAREGTIRDDYGNEVEYKIDTAKNTFEVFSWGKEGAGSDVGNIFAD